MLDYIIVGGGLAGLCFAETLLNENKSFKLLEGDLRSSSKIAGGMYNPVVLKRFTSIWKMQEQLVLAKNLYDSVEVRIGQRLNYELPILRRFASIEEQNNWFVALDKSNLSCYLSDKLVDNRFDGLQAQFGFGEVKQGGFLDVQCFIESYKAYLKRQDLLQEECFDYTLLAYQDTHVSYKGLKARHIVFAEGFSLHNNPYFKHLPLDGTKGELLIVRIPGLTIDFILKSKIFLIPLGNDLFKVGATYNWKDKTDTATQDAKLELLQGLQEVVGLDFEVVSHLAGVRPTVKDRRPLLGQSEVSSRIHVLNGLGTRGVLLGPYLAKALFNNIELGQELEHEVCIDRFKKC